MTFLERALELAERGRGTTAPNPVVGAVVVRDGEIVGEGWHERPGGPHAEVVALEAAGARARGAALYVTLEPCAHRGRTPPCADAVVAAGVTRVV
ncbi:MAG TPA: bifunctional diaminohydroxyphosphoribosylaminopyrimidine deaminase/5-amino-6-(5-phosphoribosylamino)uracil reductase RibD, partial [Gaiellaceae bacterium]|nr:bifunctional diaminohydroxyphosphoribosylaminopyrimidine deaminase/5-amino-6-(5-phosphoribosylamino)uracil reductase RibD [Gaiellaceae bacterium]